MQSNPDSDQFMSLQGGKEDSTLRLLGEWTIGNAAAVESRISDIPADSNFTVDAEGIRAIDTAGAWLIRKYFSDRRITGISGQQGKLLDFLPAGMASLPQKPRIPLLLSFFSRIGRQTLSACRFLYALFVFIGRIFSRLLHNFTRPRHFRFASIVRHIHEAGIQAIPIVSLLALLMSMVISYQGAIQLQKFGADIFTIDLTVISILREMGVLITAIIVAGRSGSAFAAEIGVMKLREEVDALKMIGMDPIEVLVLPRLIALVIVLPMLTLIVDIMGLAGGGVMSVVLLDIPISHYLDRVEYVATPLMFFIGIIKAPVFAFMIAVIGTYQGMSVSGSAESVGRLTTVAVVQSIVMVIAIDGFFSIIFAWVGI